MLLDEHTAFIFTLQWSVLQNSENYFTTLNQIIKSKFFEFHEYWKSFQKLYIKKTNQTIGTDFLY